MKSLISAALLSPLTLSLLLSLDAQGKQVALFPMDVTGNTVKETVSGRSFEIRGVRPAENVPGAKGNALRLDGYSSYVEGTMPAIISAGATKMTASVWCALECYPIVEIDVNTQELVPVVSCIDEGARTGFGFFVGMDGMPVFKAYIGGWPVEVKSSKALPVGEWANLTATVNTTQNTATLYCNGVPAASGRATGSFSIPESRLRMGRSFNERTAGPFCLTSLSALIDDFAVWDDVLSLNEISAMTAEHEADLRVPASRFANDPMRPAFHGMPGANWTNECHGMTYSNGRYHLFFQKNGNGPYMARLNWGHISSENLYNWREEKIAIVPGDNYDIKGCWSGTIFSDNEITGGRPAAIYTAVDYGRAVIAMATPDDDDLINWTKYHANPLVNGRPSVLTDDFRDPAFFRSESGAYIIVGSSINGVGTTTLHKYNPDSKTWSNDGRTFFNGLSAGYTGTFWEMPNITKIGDKWLFTVTPLGTMKGVTCLYWIGNINADGTFAPDKSMPSYFEFTNFSRDGYGLLSPTIYQHDGKTIALGIVPDKLAGEYNYTLGYAHTYSLPRELTINSAGELCQKPYSGLAGLRSQGGYSRDSFSLSGSQQASGVSGRAVELLAEFTAANGKCGFRLLDDGSSAIKVYYDASTNEIVADLREVNRMVNDGGVFDGLYKSVLPKNLKNTNVKLNVFFDHSIIDIFVNDTWASSVRVFAYGKGTENVSMFAEQPAEVSSFKAWNLDAANTVAVEDIIADEDTSADAVRIFPSVGAIRYENAPSDSVLEVYNLTGAKLLSERVEGAGAVGTTVNGPVIAVVKTTSSLKSEKMILK